MQRQRRDLVFGLLACVACAHPGTTQTPATDPNAALVVVLHRSEDVPTAIRMEVSNPNAAAVPFRRSHTAFDGLSDNIFEIRTPDAVEVPYRGPMRMHAPPESEDWVLVQPGRFHVAEVYLLEGYALQAGTTYTVRYRASSVSTLPSSPWFEFFVE